MRLVTRAPQPTRQFVFFALAEGLELCGGAAADANVADAAAVADDDDEDDGDDVGALE
jgi:hypothetical protein